MIFSRKWLISGIAIVVLTGASFLGAGCSSSPAVKQQAYAKLRETWTFEYPFPRVWKAIEEVLRNHKIVERDPKEVSAVEMKSISERSLKTDWIYSRSRDKYIEYKVNGLPKKEHLQTRLVYEIEVERILGGTKVTVNLIEEIERLDDSGKSLGYEGVDKPDTSRASELLERIKLAILAQS